ncbi:hypothetical protein J4Q44_G00310530 [Coregonus suidteri]|uniref:Uncharacterized protein n=1 Tax=Coregonus suidteri TaxID=861788 RepID=A0AAN8KTZ1_9TELE
MDESSLKHPQVHHMLPTSPPLAHPPLSSADPPQFEPCEVSVKDHIDTLNKECQCFFILVTGCSTALFAAIRRR